jgi:alkaline phosphatase
MRIRPLALAAALAAGSAFAGSGPAAAQTIYPIDRAEILAGARFDLKVELPGPPVAADAVSVTINGAPALGVLRGEVAFAADEDGGGHSALWIRNASIRRPGSYTVEARIGDARSSVRWEVFATPRPKARNVILFVGDGLSGAHRVAARMLARGIREGQYGGELAMDDMPHMALVSTSGTDSIITDSANSMSAYTTGHKTCTNALGVYCARNKDRNAHPKVETIAEIGRRVGGMAVGIVTNTDVQDATPAAVVAHTRTRRDYDGITRMLLAARPEVLLGGGSDYFLPPPAGKRRDGVDHLALFEKAGYRIVGTGTELRKAAADPSQAPLLGLFNAGNMDGVLDRRFLKKGTVTRFPDQPDLMEQVEAALAVLSRHDKGFFLMVESGLIDKYAHALDWERSVLDTIMLDNAVAVAKAWAASRDDTLIIVVGDHAHPVSIIGTYDDSRPGAQLRDKLGVYAAAGYPSYPTPDTSGYPASLDVTRRLAFVFSAFPDHCDTGRPYLAGPNQPTEAAPATGQAPAPRAFVANESTCRVPGAVRRAGNLPVSAQSGVHSAEDVILTASGPGAEGFRGHMPNTRVFRAMATALGLGHHD